MRRAMRCGSRASPIDRARAHAHGRPLHRAVHRRGLRRARRRMRGAGPDLHRRHAARGIDPGRADPRRTAWSKARRAARHSRAARARPGAIPRRRSSWTRRSAQELGEEYLKRAAVQRRTERPFFIDKLPNNWLFVPFIQLILPNAKIIDARRHPLGCCLSNFRQHFARGQDFTYDLDRPRALLCRLRAADGACRRGAAGPSPPRDLRADGRRHRGRGSGAARLLRAGVRAGMPRVLQDRAGGAHRQARSRCAGRSIATRPRSGAPTRRISGRSRTRSGPCSTLIRKRPRPERNGRETIRRRSAELPLTMSPPLCRNAVTSRMGAFDE